jgi:hypothetical protein
MNIAETEAPTVMVAKTCGYGEKRMVRYSFSDSYHNLCVDKKDIISAELEACERLLRFTTDPDDKRAIESEIAELKMALDLMP